MSKSVEDQFIKMMETVLKREFPKLLKRKEKAYREREKVLKNFESLSRQLQATEIVDQMKIDQPPTHPWRMCPGGHCWVKTHPRKVQSSKKNPDGFTTVDGHCRRNKSGKDLIYPDEINRIGKDYFKNLDVKPCPINLGFDTKKGNGAAYDDLISGWTKYWNETLKPSEKLDPNLVKALIASESSFKLKIITPVPRQKNNYARGLLQLTDSTIKILNNEKGELKNHFIKVNKNEILDPSVNIYAGIRWLFHKKKLAESKQKRSISWEETLIHYKGYEREVKKNPGRVPDGMKNFFEFSDLLKQCKK